MIVCKFDDVDCSECTQYLGTLLNFTLSIFIFYLDFTAYDRLNTWNPIYKVVKLWLQLYSYNIKVLHKMFIDYRQQTVNVLLWPQLQLW